MASPATTERLRDFPGLAGLADRSHAPKAHPRPVSAGGAWDDVIAAYGHSAGLMQALPAAAVQGLLSMSDAPEGSAEELTWIGRLSVAAARLT